MDYENYTPIATEVTDRKGIRSMKKYGYTVRHIETWHDENHSFIVWDALPNTSGIDLNSLPY